jgi:hypothetical protein
VLTSEVIAVEVVRTLVGSIGLVLAVPLTTALAAVVLTAGTPGATLEESEPVDPWERFTPEDKPLGWNPMERLRRWGARSRGPRG